MFPILTPIILARRGESEPRTMANAPTGNLDVRTAAAVFDELLVRVREQGLAVLIAPRTTPIWRRAWTAR